MQILTALGLEPDKFRDGVTQAKTLLNNGRVLITGGDPGQVYLQATNTAEIYDPNTGTFTLTGNMSAPRWYHSATFLPDGRALVAGGYNNQNTSSCCNFTNSADVFDPNTGSFTPTGNLITARGGHIAAILWTGQILLAGGDTLQGGSTVSAELYDPSTGTFSAAGKHELRTDKSCCYRFTRWKCSHHGRLLRLVWVFVLG